MGRPAPTNRTSAQLKAAGTIVVVMKVGDGMAVCPDGSRGAERSDAPLRGSVANRASGVLGALWSCGSRARERAGSSLKPTHSVANRPHVGHRTRGVEALGGAVDRAVRLHAARWADTQFPIRRIILPYRLSCERIIKG